jgi:hypothetical protein
MTEKNVLTVSDHHDRIDYMKKVCPLLRDYVNDDLIPYLMVLDYLAPMLMKLPPVAGDTLRNVMVLGGVDLATTKSLLEAELAYLMVHTRVVDSPNDDE